MNEAVNFKKLKEARERKGLSQEQVAEYLTSMGVGVTAMMVSYYERGMNTPPGDTLVHLCQLLDLSLRDFAQAA